MILTQSLINTTVLKAFCVLGTKAIKYYTGLAIGKNNTCLFREMTLLRAYIDILRNFEIVGSITTCSCSIEGKYTVVLSDDSIGSLQFSGDNIGYLYSDGTGYEFTYYYDNYNSTLIVNFEMGSQPLTFVAFTSNCSFTAFIGEAAFLFFIPKDEPATYTNTNPCIPTIVTQTCLSNNDIKKVINNVNKIIK